MKALFLLLLLAPLSTFAGDPRIPREPFSDSIVLLSRSTRTVTLYNPAFEDNTSRVLRAYPAGTVPTSVAQYDTETILVTVDGVPDRVDRINLRTGHTESGFIFDPALSGTLKGIARLSGGDVLVSDAATGAHLERFAIPNGVAPVRYTVGWPVTLLAGTQMLSPLPQNRFLACAGSTGDALGIYSGAAQLIARATALSPAPSLGAAQQVTGCVADDHGLVAAAFRGTASALRVFKPDLSATLWTFRDASLLSAPTALAVRFNGFWLVADSATNLILEISDAGERTAIFQPMLGADITALLVLH
jgi:hypothetical protein